MKKHLHVVPTDDDRSERILHSAFVAFSWSLVCLCEHVVKCAFCGNETFLSIWQSTYTVPSVWRAVSRRRRNFFTLIYLMNVLQRKMERQNDKTKHYVKRTNRRKNTQWTAAATTASKRRVRERESEREWQKIVCNYLTNNLLLIQYNWPLLEHHFHFNGRRRCRRWYYILRCDAAHTHRSYTNNFLVIFILFVCSQIAYTP